MPLATMLRVKVDQIPGKKDAERGIVVILGLHLNEGL
jgi:hypothetical protein